MKQCPTCLESYSDQLQFCLTDGTGLVTYVHDLTDQETVIRKIPDQAVVPTPSSVDSGWRTLAILLGGVTIGGILVLVTIFALRPTEIPNPPLGENSQLQANTIAVNRADSVPTNSNVGIAPRVEDESNATDGLRTAKTRQPTDPLVTQKDKLLRKGFNGRVVMMNAIIRAAPTMYAEEVQTVGYDEILKIGKSAGGNNPWYRVTTANGITGWMHGNTIEFIRR